MGVPMLRESGLVGVILAAAAGLGGGHLRVGGGTRGEEEGNSGKRQNKATKRGEIRKSHVV